MKRGLMCLVISILFASAVPASAAPGVPISGLTDEVKVIRDHAGIPHILASNEHDLILTQGWVHARDRFFQMDVFRRTASGTLAELLGPAALASDVELRTIGLRRAAERSLAAISPETLASLRAYADGVNAYLATHALPAEYGPLELTGVPDWTPVDSLAIGKLIAFSLSFDLDISLTEALLTYRGAGAALGFDGDKLFSEDLFRSAPFDPAATIPDAGGPAGLLASAETGKSHGKSGRSAVRQTARSGVTASKDEVGAGSAGLKLALAYRERVKDLPLFKAALEPGKRPKGSNEWAVSGRLTRNGKPLIANDPHLGLDTPPIWYQNHLRAPAAGIDVIGSSFAGVPFVVLGHNRHIAWGGTVHPMDVTDTFQEQVVQDPNSPSGLSTIYLGANEPVLPIPVQFNFNILGDGMADILQAVPPGGGIPPVVLVMPRRDMGPIVSLDVPAGAAISIQYTGFSPTRELDAFRGFNIAGNMDEFIAALQFFDFGSQNFAYADTRGNIAYFTSAELPIREDLQAGFVAGLPPYFIRNGTGGNEWLDLSTPQPGQAVPHEVLPFEEMPKIINPPAGYFVNANNDPTGHTRDNNVLNDIRPGGGIFYLNPGYAIGTRAGRISQALGERIAAGKVTLEDMQAVQSDVVLLDAQAIAPYILAAFEHAGEDGAHPLLQALASDPRVVEAVGRLAQWDYSTPTGVFEGFDASDTDGVRLEPSDEEVAHSISATIYSVWRGQMIANTMDAVLDALGMPRPGSAQAMTALRNMLDNFDEATGLSASGLSFFKVPGVVEPAARRDIVILKSLTDALDRLAGPAFAEAFGNSGNQQDYRWGRLHRIVLDHPLGGPFNTPPAGGEFPPSFADLDGFAVDGGFGAVDASSHSARASDSHGFMFGSGPSRRFAAEVINRGRGFNAETSLPGGESGDLGNPLHVNLLGSWLTNESHGLILQRGELQNNAMSTEKFVPSP